MTSESIITLVRHGETSANQDGIWHGSTDTPLSERGHLQAARVASFVAESFDNVTAVYSSPLERARHTAQPIAEALGLTVVTHAGLSEYDLGSWEGKSYAELHSEYRLWHHIKRDPDYAPHGGESPRQVSDRYAAALHEIVEQHTNTRIVVVGHGGALSMTLGLILDRDYSQWRRVMSNCAVTELVLAPEPALLRFNHTKHLEDLA
jgi:broad specificity phosphatase PhoE